MTKHSKCETVMANLSVDLSVRHTLVLYLNKCTYHKTPSTAHYGYNPSFWTATAITKFQGEPPQWGLSTWEWANFTIFDWNRCLSWKQYEIGPWLLWITNRKSYVAKRSMSVSVTLKDRERQNARVKFSWWITENYVCVVWRRMAKFGIVTQVVEERVSEGSASHLPVWAGPSIPKIIWDPLPMK